MRLWQHFPRISQASIVVVAVFFLLFVIPQGPLAAEVGGLSTTYAAPCLYFAYAFLLIALTLYVRYGVLPRLKDEANERLAAPLPRALANSGWTVKVGCAASGRRSPAPEGLDRRCMTAGWIWLDFRPADFWQVGAPLAASTY